MIIICKECSTKFKLDESLLKETGSKVRCCACKYIFTAYPPQALGRTEVSHPLPSQQGYFNSEEELGPGGVGGFQKTRQDDDDDGLELDVDEEEDDMDVGGLDFGDDDSGFDDGGIDLGNKMSDMDTGMNFDEDMDTGMPDVEFDDDIESGDIDFDTEINLNMDQGEEIELDAESDLTMDPDEPEPDESEIMPGLEPEQVDDESISDEDDFEFEFELDEEENLETQDDLKLDEPSAESGEFEEDQNGDSEEEDFDLSLFDEENLDEEIETASPELIEEDTFAQMEPEEVDDYDSMELEIDDDILGDDDDDNYEIEEVDDDILSYDDEFEEEDNYEIEEYDDDEQEYKDNDIFDELDEDEEIVIEDKPEKAPKKSGKLLKVLLILLILLGVGYAAFTATGGFTKGFDLSKINFSIVKNLFNFSKMDQIPVWATINNQSLNGRYVNNEVTGKLFVITGKITNESSIPLNHIQVEGTLISKGGVVAKKKKVFCGNKIPEGQLSSSSISAMNRILQRKDGEQGANLNIKANESIPFMVVFSSLPEELENYTVTVTEFNRMKN